MMMERQSKIAIAASLLFMAMATFVILGTHGEAVAKAGAAEPGIAPTSGWMTLPAAAIHVREDFAVGSRC